MSHVKMNGTKSMVGHALGASGGLEAIATIQAIRTGELHPTLNQVRAPCAEPACMLWCLLGRMAHGEALCAARGNGVNCAAWALSIQA